MGKSTCTRSLADYMVLAGLFLGLAIRRARVPAPLTAVDALLAPARMLVVLEAVTNADNVGGVFRNAAAFRAGGVLLSPTCCDPLYRKAIRTSMGATLRVPFARAGADECAAGTGRRATQPRATWRRLPGRSSRD
jgi:tRNA G18 (ribose-2'-O)-methylase SpoU